MKEEPNYPSIDPELEARIVALVLGEASDFERDDLNRLIEQRPELAAFKEEMQRVHGLLKDVGAGESTAEDDDWKLSAEKRNAVLAAISGEAKERPATQVVSKSTDQQRSKQISFLGNVAKIAAVLLVAGSLGSLAIVPSVKSARESARRQVASSETPTLDIGAESLMGEGPAAGAHIFMADGAVTMTPDEVPLPAAEAIATKESDYKKDSRSSLSAIRESLGADVAVPTPDYLMDDVQYLPAMPKLNLPQEVTASGESGLMRRVEEQRRATEGRLRAEVKSQLRTPENRPELAMPALESQESGEGQSNRTADLVINGFPAHTGRISLGGAINSDAGVTEAKPSAQESSQGLAGGTNLRFSGDSRAAGVSSELMPEESDLSLWFGAGELSKTAPSKPMVAGIGGRKREAEKASDDEDFDMAIPADSIAGPTNQPMSSREDLNEKEITDGMKEEFAKDRLALGFAGRRGIPDEGESNGQQIPVTGTAIGQPSGELQLGKATQDQRGYGAQPKSPVGGPAGLKSRNEEAFSEHYGEGAENYWERVPSKQEDKGVQRDQLAVNEQSRRYRYIPPMLEDNPESMKRKQATSNAWATRLNREWLEKLPRPQQESESMRMAPAKRYVAPAGLNEKAAKDEAFSTFSLHVSDVSFKLARAALASGTWPEAAKVRIEEFVNAFDYGDPMPSQSEKVACRVEQSVHPFLQQRNLLRVSMRTAAAGRSSNTPLRLTFLLDNSGSMERIDRQQTVRRAFALLAQQLKPIDQVTLISFARQPRLLADKVSGAQSHQLVGLVENLPSEGGTNIEAALKLAFEKAREQQVGNAQNRIILLTDGAVNLGDANPESLSRMITTMRGVGIAFDAAGISAEGLNDEILEALTRKGDGRYYLLDSLEAADDGFARQIAGALRPSAMNVKVQVEFNPKRVGRYKLLGFEKHRLEQEDFRNDKVDAAEMTAAEAGVAVYQFEAKPDGEGDVGSVSVRFRDVSTQQMIQNCWPIAYQPDALRLDQAAPSLRIATSAALLAAKLRGEALGETVDLKTLSNLIAGLPDQDRNANRVGQLQQMIEQARQVSGK